MNIILNMILSKIKTIGNSFLHGGMEMTYHLIVCLFFHIFFYASDSMMYILSIEKYFIGKKFNQFLF